MQEAFGCRPATGDVPGGTRGGPPRDTPGETPRGTSDGTPGGLPRETPGGPPGGTPRGTPGGFPRETPGGSPSGTPGEAPGGTSRGTGDATDAVAVLDALLADLDAAVHRPAPLERGFALQAGDWPLHVGARAVAGLLELQAEVAPPGAVDPAWLLHRNRRDVRVVRYGSSAEGATWVHGDLAFAAVTPEALDDLLARLVGAAEAAAAVAVWPDWG